MRQRAGWNVAWPLLAWAAPRRAAATGRPRRVEPYAASRVDLVPGLEGPAEVAVFGLVGLLSTLVAFAALVVVAKLGYRLVARLAGGLNRLAAAAPVADRHARVGAVTLLAFALVAGVGVQVQEGTTSLWEGESGAAGRANDLKQQGLDGDPLGGLEADVVGVADAYSGPPYDRPAPDTDGDRLKDAWEERGRTPGGARLPDADPHHKDLYVQVDYGANVSRFSAAERRALERAFARMPVSNPDGESGIDLHVVEGRTLPTTPRFGSADAGSLERYYTREHLGARRCRYHQVVVGRVTAEGTAGYGAVPGYVAVVDGRRRPAFEANTSLRVYVTTHELLHNVVGYLPDGGTHTTGGWLSPEVDPDDDHLPAAARDRLNDGLAGSGYFQHQVCARSGTTTRTATP